MVPSDIHRVSFTSFVFCTTWIWGMLIHCNIQTLKMYFCLSAFSCTRKKKNKFMFMLSKHGIKTIAFEGVLVWFCTNSCIIFLSFQLEELCRHKSRESSSQADLHRKTCHVPIQNDFYFQCIENRRTISHGASLFSQVFTDNNIINLCEIAL